MPVHVIDVNLLQDEDLGHWLAASPSNIAMLTEFVMMEIWACSSDAHTILSFDIIRHFPSQILRMHDCNRLRTIDGNRPIEDLIDAKSTDDLRLLLMTGGYTDPRIIYAMRGNRSIAHSKLLEIERATASNKALIESIGPNIRQQVVRRTQDGGPILSEEGVNGVKHIAIQLAQHFHDRAVASGMRSPCGDLMATFEMRYAAAATASMVIRLCHGSVAKLSDKTTRNDVVDCNHIACSTYVHGFRSKDVVARQIHRFLLEHLLTGKGTGAVDARGGADDQRRRGG